ncbi:MAG: PPC domain-containing DNA-binding protein [Acidimicrobiia bacterium]|nr:PPC domain-containing DNA-binding protein [Acidimicrobiia bacterium]
MSWSRTFEPGPVHLVRLPTGADLLEGITGYAADRGIHVATVQYLGAVRRASLRYYDQEALEYRDFVIDEHLEVLSGVGNVSLLDGEPFVHTHMALADADGRAFGGHVNVGTEVWAIEIRLQELLGAEPPVRLPDDCTGLTLWGGNLD